MLSLVEYCMITNFFEFLIKICRFPDSKEFSQDSFRSEEANKIQS